MVDSFLLTFIQRIFIIAFEFFSLVLLDEGRKSSPWFTRESSLTPPKRILFYSLPVIQIQEQREINDDISEVFTDKQASTPLRKKSAIMEWCSFLRALGSD